MEGGGGGGGGQNNWCSRYYKCTTRSKSSKLYAGGMDQCKHVFVSIRLLASLPARKEL